MDFADVIKLEAQDGEVLLDYPEDPTVITSILRRRRQRDQNQKKVT